MRIRTGRGFVFSLCWSTFALASWVLLPCALNAQTPTVVPGGVVNSASFTAPVVAGSAASLFGTDLSSGTNNTFDLPLPTTLAGTTVFMDGIAVPLFFVSSLQINFQVPWELAGQTQASLTVTTDSGTSSPITVNLATFAPGFVALYQVNVQVPENVTLDTAVPVVITIGGVSSNTVTMATQSGAEQNCFQFPGGIMFSVVHYITSANAAGDFLVVGDMPLSTQNLFPLPNSPNQRFCGEVEIAPGLFAEAYVPTTDERQGIFSSFEGLLVDPLTGEPFPGGFMPLDPLFAWRVISTSQVAPGNPVPTLTSLSPSSATQGDLGFTLSVSGSNFLAGSVVRWNGEERVTTFVSSTELQASISATDIAAAGTAEVTVFNPPLGGGISGSVTFSINPPPAVNPGGLVNGASFAGGVALASGSITSLFGSNLAAATVIAESLPLPTTLGGVTVEVNGIAAPLFFVSPGQINFQIPHELEGQSEVSVTVTVDGVTSSPETVELAPSSPAIFSTDSSGSGQGAVLIANTAIYSCTSRNFLRLPPGRTRGIPFDFLRRSGRCNQPAWDWASSFR